MRKILLTLLCYIPFLWVTVSCGDNSTSGASGTNPKVAHFKQEVKRVISKMKSYRSALNAIGTKDNSKLAKEKASLKGEMDALQELAKELNTAGLGFSSKEQKELKVLGKDFKQEVEGLKKESAAFKRF